MPEEAQTGLFGRLPEEVSAARPVGAPRLRKAERRQVSLRPISLEDLPPPDHRARFVWAFAERLDLSALYGAIKAVEGGPGHPPADPRVLLELWLDATVEGVGTAGAGGRLRSGGWRGMACGCGPRLAQPPSAGGPRSSAVAPRRRPRSPGCGPSWR